ncbi:putative Lysosomal alpha-glucosidase [Blattamonas nauphoetae]|uniref:Maltase n=1 Tax=Blattamonas nauphoetae TaxID=2049346 RepID=A0ABQ9YI63_9EUKA|nr:putative Lysosomal alpha-glucosidase [Blattamonas nauphoetae]
MFILTSLIAYCLAIAEYKQTVEQTAYGYKGTYKKESGQGPFPPDAETMNFELHIETENRLHFRIFDPLKPNREIPDVILPAEVTEAAQNPNFEITFENNGMQVIRKSTKDVIWDSSTSTRGLVFADEFIQIDTSTSHVPIIYGLHERRTRFALPSKFNYSLYTVDRNTPADGKGLYGQHPFYVELRPGGDSHGVLFLNSHPSEVEVERGFISFRSMGGMLDFYILLGPSQEDVMRQYTDLVGRPCLVPQWAMGFHNCKWGYKSLTEVQGVVDSYRQNNMPIDCIWFDIDYMNEYRLFTLDPVNYPGDKLRAFLKEQKETHGTYSTAIVDPGVFVDENYAAYKELVANKMHLNTPRGDMYIGKVWPGSTIFPDFSNNNIQDYWYKFHKTFLEEMPLDGIWNDMNEIANFCDGYCNESKDREYAWTPANLTVHQTPTELTCHHGPWLEARGFYGNQENKHTAEALRKLRPGKRPFILSRASFVGAGRTNTIWLGDNHGTYSDMEDSIAGVLTSGLSGLPYVGADIGGFTWDNVKEKPIDPNLVTRWIQVGTFLYPFYRNHIDSSSGYHEWYRFGETYTAINRKFMEERQHIQSLFYTLMHESHQTGAPIVRSMSYVFRFDGATYEIDNQAMLGSTLLVTPVLKNNTNTVKGYFPQERWYDYWTNEEDSRVTMKGAEVSLETPLDSINVHIKGGSIFARQRKNALALSKMWDTPFYLTAALDSSLHAEGQLFVDNHDDSNDENVLQMKYTCTNTTMTVRALKRGFRTNQIVEGFMIVGLKQAAIRRVQITPNVAPYSFNYNAEKGKLQIQTTGNGWPVGTELNIQWA